MKKKKKNRMWIPFIIPVALFLAYGIFPMVYSPFSTQTALEYTMSESVESTGLIIREEVLVYHNGSGIYGFSARDGERITATSNIGDVFQTESQAFSVIQLRNIDEEILLLETAQNLSAYTHTDLNIIIKQTQSVSYQLASIIDTGDYSTLSSIENNLNFYYNRMQVATGQEEAFETLLAIKRAERDTTALMAGAPSSHITAPISGYFSSVIDGYENSITNTEAQSMSPFELQEYTLNFLPTPNSTAIARIQPDYRWYVYTTIPFDEGRSFVVGKRVFVSFLYSSTTNLSAEIILVEVDEENEIIKIGLLFTEVSSETVNMQGIQPINISFSQFTGLRIDKRALHIVDGVTGVYVRYGNIVQFKPINPIFEDENYYLVPLEPTAENGVRLYDEIIVEGTDLYDGKLLS